MAKNQELIRKSNRAAAAALFALIPIFLSVVTIGWRQILESLVILPEIGEFQIFLQYAIALLIALIGVILARGVATERRRIMRKIDVSAHGTWIAYFFVLMMISALGTINTFFMWSESKTVLTEMIDKTEHFLRALKLRVTTNIATPLHDRDLNTYTEERQKTYTDLQELKTDLGDLYSQQKADFDRRANEADVFFNNFIREATNPQRPGVGPEARRLFVELQSKLPIQPLSGSMSGLSGAMVTAYEQAYKDARRSAFNVDTSVCNLPERARQTLKKIEYSVPSIPDFVNLTCGRIDEKTNDLQKRIESEFSTREPRISDDEKRKIDFLTNFKSQIDEEIARLDANRNNTSQLNKARTGPILKAAWSKYADLRDQSQKFVGAEVIDALPQSISDEKIDKLGLISNTVEILVHRLDHFQTYFIVFVGLIFDIVLIAFFSRHVSSIDDQDEDDFFPYEGAPRKGKIKNLFNE